MNKYEQVKKYFEDLQNRDVRVRSLSYSGKGRPKKSDYKIIKFKDLMNFEAMERLQFGFNTSYIKK